jgi:hypothetical protein
LLEKTMAQNAFVKSFLPGLVLGLIVGALAGAFLPPLLESRETFDETAVTAPRERTAPTPEQIEEARREMEEKAAEQAPKEGEPVAPVAPVTPAAEPEAAPVVPST